MSKKITNIRNLSLITELLSLDLPSEDYAIFGSAPIAANGLTDFSKINDLDLIVRNRAWKKAKQLSKVTPIKTNFGFGDTLSFFKKGDEFDISLYTGWGHGNWNIDELIDTADVIDGIRFVTLKNVLKWKKARNMPKDALHIKLIEKQLKAKAN